MQTVEQLSLVFMDSLDLNVEHGVGVDLHLVVLFQVHSKLQLVFLHFQNMNFIKQKTTISAYVVICRHVLRILAKELYDGTVRLKRKRHNSICSSVRANKLLDFHVC